jgi:hypothetical protein
LHGAFPGKWFAHGAEPREISVNERVWRVR